MADEKTNSLVWNQRWAIDEDAGGFWQIGPFKLWASRLPTEYRVAFLRDSGAQEQALRAEVPSSDAKVPEEATRLRIGFRTPPRWVELVPVLADRPLVVRPEDPLLLLPPQEEVTLYISTPLWVRVVAGEEAVVLLDEPISRPTDTWFGPSTTEGELCYASSTSARMSLDSAPVRSYQAVSVVRILNHARTDLRIERLRLPTQQMSVFATATGQLWTESITITHQQDEAAASIHLDKGPPNHVAAATEVGAPRSPSTRGLLTRAFAGLLG